jgi:hypothetical protein
MDTVRTTETTELPFHNKLATDAVVSPKGQSLLTLVKILGAEDRILRPTPKGMDPCRGKRTWGTEPPVPYEYSL